MKNLLISIAILLLLVLLFSRYGPAETRPEQGGIPAVPGDGTAVQGEGNDLVLYAQLPAGTLSPNTGRVHPFRLLAKRSTLWNGFWTQWRRR